MSRDKSGIKGGNKNKIKNLVDSKHLKVKTENGDEVEE